MSDQNKTAKLTALQNNTGSARTDEYYFLSNEIDVQELYTLAFKKDTVIAITDISEGVKKMTYVLTLT